MSFLRSAAPALFFVLLTTFARAQQPTPPVAEPPSVPSQDSSPKLTHRPPAASAPAKNPTSIALTVPKGTAIQVALDKEVRVQKVGQVVHGHVVEPIYAFDKLVIPVGAEVTGHITKIEILSAGRRTAAALDTDFSPTRKLDLTFDELVLADSKRIPLHTNRDSRLRPGHPVRHRR